MLLALQNFHDQQSANDELRPPFSLPPRIDGFFGRRQDLQDLIDLLTQRQSVHIAASVRGMAGIGKSALAAEVIHRVMEDPRLFPGGVTWLSCAGQTKMSGLAWLYRQLVYEWNIVLPLDTTTRATTRDEEAAVLQRILRANLGPSKRQPQPDAALVLLDNVEYELPINQVLPTLRSLGITVLVTSRHEINWPQIRQITLDVLETDPSVTLFAERYKARGGTWDNTRDADHARHVVELLGRLPLAIELAAARAARRKSTPESLAAELSVADRLGKLKDPNDPTRSVRYAFEQSLRLLSQDQYARFVSLGSANSIEWPRSILERSFELLPVTEGTQQPSDDIDVLISLSLLSPLAPAANSSQLSDTGAASNRIRIHPLLHELAQQQWRQQSAEYQQLELEALVRALETVLKAIQQGWNTPWRGLSAAA